MTNTALSNIRVVSGIGVVFLLKVATYDLLGMTVVKEPILVFCDIFRLTDEERKRKCLWHMVL